MNADNEDTRETLVELESLTRDERAVLAVLASVGAASLSVDEVAAVTEIEHVEAILAALERRGLVRKEDRRRALQPALVPRLRRVWDLADTADRVLRQLISIAEDGKLTLDDLDAVLNIAEWAGQAGRAEELVHLVRAAESALVLTRRVEAWVELVQRAHTAARQLRDRETEAWAEEQLRRFERTLGRAARVEKTARLRPGHGQPPRALLRLLLATVVLAVTAAAGYLLGSGLAGGSDEQNGTGATLSLPGETVTLPGQTVTVGGTTISLPRETVRLPGETVTLPAATVTVTTTELATTTVTLPAGPG